MALRRFVCAVKPAAATSGKRSQVFNDGGAASRGSSWIIPGAGSLLKVPSAATFLNVPCSLDSFHPANGGEHGDPRSRWQYRPERTPRTQGPPLPPSTIGATGAC